MSSSLQIVFPHDGDILNRHDGRETDDALVVPITGMISPEAPVTVNGVAATVEGESFTCAVPLNQREEVIEARASEGAAASISVLCDFKSRPRYRFSVDDSIHWLADLGQHPKDYDSLFDHWFLAFWQQMHQDYGTKVHLNIYYQTVDQRFNISQFPNKWRAEFEDNSDWLHLSFHALQDKPDRIYKEATYDQLAHDFELVMNEIRRFAGEAVTSRVTTVHWWEAPREACQALFDRGVDTLQGFFVPVGNVVNNRYYLDVPTAKHISSRDAWKDNSTGIIFVSCDAVIDRLNLDDVIPCIQNQAADAHTGEMIELLAHEQHFRSGLSDEYQADITQRVEQAIKWVSEQGYEPCFWSEGFLGSQQ